MLVEVGAITVASEPTKRRIGSTASNCPKRKTGLRSRGNPPALLSYTALPHIHGDLI